MKKYHTKQKDIILDIIKKQKNEFTVQQIYDEIKEEVGLTTIYRLIDKLVSEGRITKNIGMDKIPYYQYLEECKEENHFYLKCINCGKIIHIDCDCIEELSNHIIKNHKFKLSKDHIIINGTCEQCNRK